MVVKLLEKVGLHVGGVDEAAIDAEIRSRAERGVEGVVRSCATCFVAGTLVATPHGERAIERLRVGDSVLSEDPTAGKVEAEAVQAVIQDPVSPLLAVELGDGSAITTTVTHAFWVDEGASKPGWLEAGRLRVGDRLREADGTEVVVAGLRRNVGRAVVYTLTVAKDHTFFAGAAQVLVHNADCFGREIVKTFTGANVFEAFGKARADAQAEARLGSDVVDFVSEIGPMKGKVVGRQSADGLRGWRLDWDPTNPAKGLHVNWWDKTGGAKRANWRFGANIVAGGTEHDYLYLLNRFPSP